MAGDDGTGEGETPEGMVDIPEGVMGPEWVRHPGLVLRETRLLAKLKKAVNDAKADLDVTRAEAALAIRKDPGKYGLDKATEATIEARVTTHKRVMRAVAAFNDARFRVDDQEAVVKGLDNKKAAMEAIGFLDAKALYAEPSTARLNGKYERLMADRTMTETVVRAGPPKPKQKRA